MRTAEEAHSSELISAAAYGLAFANDRASLEKLQDLVTHKSPRVSDAARFALLLRGLVRVGAKERLRRMTAELDAPHDWLFRLFLANWLGCEYGEEILPTFVTKLAREDNKNVRLEYLYHLTHSANAQNVDAALSYLETGDANRQLPEDMSAVLSTLTPNRRGQGSHGMQLLKAARVAREKRD